MSYSLDERTKIIAEFILCRIPEIPEQDLGQMLMEEIEKPMDQMNLSLIDEILNALDPTPLSEQAKKAFIQKMSEMLGINN